MIIYVSVLLSPIPAWKIRHTHAHTLSYVTLKLAATAHAHTD